MASPARCRSSRHLGSAAHPQQLAAGRAGLRPVSGSLTDRCRHAVYGAPPRRRGEHRSWFGRSGTAEHPRLGGEDHVDQRQKPNGYGTPPRRRGGRVEGAAGGGHRRYTPASAGRTSAGARGRDHPPEHPRVGGEDPSTARTSPLMTGTPPRRRGGRHGAPDVVPVPRNTPASAGRTSASPRSTPARTEHPRVGGEDTTTVTVAPGMAGTPPRRRGGPLQAGVVGGDGRNTPASAGRTGSGRRRRAPPAEHPRVGGEDRADVGPLT